MTTEFEKAIERAVGEPIESIRETPIDDRRRNTEQKFGKPMEVVSIKPHLITHRQIEADLEKALR